MASDSIPEISESLITESFDDFMYCFVQAGVQHAHVHLLNPFHVPIVDEDLTYWQTKGAMPSSAEAGVTQRAHERIFSNFRKVLHILERDNSSPTAYNTMILELRRDGFIITPNVPAFHNRRIGDLAKFCSIAEAQIQASFPRLQQRLREMDLYQPYKPPEPLIPAVLEYMHSFGHQRLHTLHHSYQFESIFRSLIQAPINDLPKALDETMRTLATSTEFRWRDRIVVIQTVYSVQCRSAQGWRPEIPGAALISPASG